MKQQTVIITTHSTRVFGPPFALADYLKKEGYELIFIDHPLDFEPDRRSRYTHWRGQEKVAEWTYPNWFRARAINYLKDLVVTGWILLAHVKRRPVAYYFGFDSLSSAAALWLRPFLRINKIVGYNADYSTIRFDSPFLNAVYLWADRYTMYRVDLIWCVTERIAKIRRAQRPRPSDVSVVPNGAYLDVAVQSHSKASGLVYVGNLTPEKGADELIKAMVNLPDLTLTIIGDGGEREPLESLVKELGLQEQVFFLGHKSNQETLELLPQYEIGIALYQESQSYVYYSDPLKVKEYLASGLPVIITRVPEIADIILREQAGVAITLLDEFPAAVKTVLSNATHMRSQARKLAKRFNWDIIFYSALKDTQQSDDFSTERNR